MSGRSRSQRSAAAPAPATDDVLRRAADDEVLRLLDEPQPDDAAALALWRRARTFGEDPCVALRAGLKVVAAAPTCPLARFCLAHTSFMAICRNEERLVKRGVGIARELKSLLREARAVLRASRPATNVVGSILGLESCLIGLHQVPKERYLDQIRQCLLMCVVRRITTRPLTLCLGLSHAFPCWRRSSKRRRRTRRSTPRHGGKTWLCPPTDPSQAVTWLRAVVEHEAACERAERDGTPPPNPLSLPCPPASPRPCPPPSRATAPVPPPPPRRVPSAAAQAMSSADEELTALANSPRPRQGGLGATLRWLRARAAAHNLADPAGGLAAGMEAVKLSPGCALAQCALASAAWLACVCACADGGDGSMGKGVTEALRRAVAALRASPRASAISEPMSAFELVHVGSENVSTAARLELARKQVERCAAPRKHARPCSRCGTAGMYMPWSWCRCCIDRRGRQRRSAPRHGFAPPEPS